MSFLGGLLGFGASAGLGLLQSGLDYAFSAKAQQQQFENQKALNQQAYDLTQQGYREQYGNLRQGLENAGYNPMLALNPSGLGSYSGGSATAVKANSYSGSDWLNSVSTAKRAFDLEEKKNKSDIDLINSTIRNTDAKTKTEGYNQQLLQSQYLLNQIDTELKRKDLSWKDRMYLMQEKTGYINAAAAHLGAEAQQLNANTAKQHLQLDREMQTYEKDIAKRYMQFGKNHPYLRNFDETLSRFFKGSFSYSKR